MACPTENDLAAFAEGTLDARAIDAVEIHLADCADCCALVASARDTGGRTNDGFREDEALRVLRERIGAAKTFGRYEIVESLGYGGMGIVYRARDSKLQRDVALKVVSIAHPSGTDRLLREARAAAALAHPSVVKIFEAAIHEDTAYIVMELVPGTTLRQQMRLGEASESVKIGWIVALADVLAHAHDQGIIHRDIKPENVMIREDGSLAVLDFGLARRPLGTLVADDAPRLTTLTKKGMLVGTPAYMPPEQLLGERVDARADQFAWGAVAYELLAGRRPWEARGAVDLFDRMMSEAPAPLPANVPERLRRAILRALEIRAEERLPSMHEALRAFDEARDDLSTRVYDAPNAGALRKRAALAMTVVAAFCCALVVRWGLPSKPLRPTVPFAAREREASSLSTNPEALGEYRLGLQAAKDAASATAHFERATAIDPWFAAAHLRFVVNTPPSNHDPLVTHYHVARRLRSTLDSHDRILLDAYEPMSRDAADAREAAKRVELALQDAPADPDYLVSLCFLRFFAGAYDAATEACDAAARADGTLANAYWMKGLSRIFADDIAGATAAYDRCLEVSPAGTSCISDRINLEMNEGRCENAVADARQYIALEPQNANGYVLLANALAGAHGPTEATELALAQRWWRVDAPSKPLVELRDRADLAIYEADYDAAIRWLSKRDEALTNVRDEWEHLALFRERAMLALETGHPDEASSLADAFLLKRNAVWNAHQGTDDSIVAWGIQYRAGTMSRTELGERRANWLAAERKKPTFDEQASSRGLHWVTAFAEPAKTEEDALEALRVLPAYLPLPDAYTRSPDFDEPIGRVYLLAHRLPEALGYLGRAARACTPIFFVMYQLDAKRELAEAESQIGDSAEACSAYSAIVAQWGSMKGSRSAALARTKATLLHCR